MYSQSSLLYQVYFYQQLTELINVVVLSPNEARPTAGTLIAIKQNKLNLI